MSEQINKVLYNVDQTADTTAAQKAQARANIGAVSSSDVSSAITSAVNSLDYQDTAVPHQFVTKVDEVDGVVSVTRAQPSTSDISGLSDALAAKQDTLTTGPNIDIINNIISTEKTRVTAGTNVSVASSIDNVTRTVTYTVSAADTTYSAGNGITIDANNVISATGLSGVSTVAPLYGDGTSANPLVLRTSHGLSLVQPAGGDTYLQVTHPVPAPGSTSTNKVLTCLDSLENLGWRDASNITTTTQGPDEQYTTHVGTLDFDLDTHTVHADSSSVGLLAPVMTPTEDRVLKLLAGDSSPTWIIDKPITQTGDSVHPVFVNSNDEAEQCSIIPYVGSQVNWTLKDNVTIQSVTTEQDWALGPQRSWPYGFEPAEIDYSAIVTTPTDIIVRVYMREFLYVNETYTPLAEELVWVGMVKAGTEGLQWHIRTKGLNNNIYTYNGRVTFQTLTATSGSIVVSGQCGNYHTVPRGYTLGTTPSVPAPPPWTPPNT